ncbi:hypothetical protein Tco_0932622 [Tanacetum coccineum]
MLISSQISKGGIGGKGSPPRNRYIAAKTDISLKSGRPPRYRRAIFTTLDIRDDINICKEIDGVIAMGDWSLSNLFLYNPLTGKHVPFPPIPLFDICDYISICGEIDGVVAMGDWSLSNLFLYNPRSLKTRTFSSLDLHGSRLLNLQPILFRS